MSLRTNQLIERMDRRLTKAICDLTETLTAEPAMIEALEQPQLWEEVKNKIKNGEDVEDDYIILKKDK